jgi:hypothetical protein
VSAFAPACSPPLGPRLQLAGEPVEQVGDLKKSHHVQHASAGAASRELVDQRMFAHLSATASSAAADPWYSSAIFWAIVAGVATVVGTVGTWVTLFVTTPRRRLIFGIRAAAPIMTAPEALRSELEVFDRGVKLDQPRFVEIELVGRGRRDIRRSDFGRQPIELTVGGRIVRVLTVNSNESARRPPAVRVSDDGTALHVGPGVIGRRQHIVISLLTDGPKPTLSCQASFADVDVRPARGNEIFRSRTSKLLRVGPMASIGLAIAMVLILVTPTGRQDAFGVDRSIELSPLCVNDGGIVAPPAEANAAYQYHCARSGHVVARAQVEQRCKTQWPTAELVLRDPQLSCRMEVPYAWLAAVRTYV